MSIGIRLVFNLHQFGFRFVSDWLFIWFKLVVDWHSIGCQFAFNLVLIFFKLVVNWHLIGCQYAFDWEPISIPLAVHWNQIFISSCIALVLQLHPNVCQLADYHWIGKLQIWTTKKSDWNRGFSLVESSEYWLLIGREAPQKIFKEGTLMILNLFQLSVFDLNWNLIGSYQIRWMSIFIDCFNRF